MLTEFAFTPSLFDEEAHEDKEAWRDQLKELGRNMFPRVSAWPVVVSDLYAGSWNQVADQTVKAIKDEKARVLCEGILQNMRLALVSRPVCGDWPDGDIAWGREAIASNATESIERIVANAATKAALLSEYKDIRSLDEVENNGFWHAIAADASPNMVICEQVALLRKLCLHSEWVALINPHTFGQEQDFCLRLLELSLKRDSAFGPISFELHAQTPDVVDPVERQKRQQTVTTNMVQRIQGALKGAHPVRLYFWPKMLDRILIAGRFETDSKGNRLKSPRWGVSMSHVAHGVDPNAPATEWKLLRRDRLNDWFRKYVADGIAGKPSPTTIGPASTPGWP